MSSCLICTKIVRPRQQRLECISCNGLCHRTCTSITQAAFRAGIQPWHCRSCETDGTTCDLEPTIPYMEPPVLERTCDMEPTIPYMEMPVLERTCEMEPTIPYGMDVDPPVLEVSAVPSAPLDSTFIVTNPRIDEPPVLEVSDLPMLQRPNVIDDEPPTLELSVLPPADSTHVAPPIADTTRAFGLSPVRREAATFVVSPARQFTDKTMQLDRIPESDSDDLDIIRDDELDASFDVRQFTDAADSLDVTFDLPDRPQDDAPPIVERSLDDPLPTDTVIEEQPIRYEIVEHGSNKRRRKLVGDGYAYTVKTTTSRTTTWRCSVRNKTVTCPATVLQRDGTFIPGSCDHVHQPDFMLAKRVKISDQVKVSALAQIHQSAGTIAENVMTEMIETRDFDLPRPDNLARAANRLRQNLRPKDPRSLDFEIDHNFLRCPEFVIGDVRVDDQRHILFATEQQLSILRQARRWYLDGTFKIRKEPFQQLYSVHAFLQKEDSCKQVPLVFILMSSRRTQDYDAVFRKLKECLGNFAVEGFVLDFESACWSAIRAVFPGTELKGCSFHWAQAVLRKVGNLGLRPTYDLKQGVHRFVKQLLALPFLPSRQIETSFESISRLANTPELRDLCAYINRYWVKHRVWSPVNWCVYRQSVRTNNDVEGWHHRVNTKAGRANLPFYMLVPLLRAEARLVDIQARLVCENALHRHQRTSYRRIQGRITKLWDSYDAEDVSTSTFLRKVGQIYAPRPTQEPDREADL